MLGVVNNVNGGVLGSNNRNDNLAGDGGNNTFFVGRGNDTIDGRGGRDVLNVDGEAIEWTFNRLPNGTIIMTHPTWGENRLTNVEAIFFARSGETLNINQAIAATNGLPDQRIDSDNVLNGTNGNDTLRDARGIDGLYGGVGNDRYEGVANDFSQVNYDGERSEYTITQNNDGSITVTHPIWGRDRLIDIDSLLFTGREPGVDGEVTGNFEQINVADLDFDAAPAPPAPPNGGITVINGSNRDDNLTGSQGDDDIFGRNGDDIIRGGRGEDVIFGGDGDDNIFGGADSDGLFGGDGSDIIRGGRGDDFISGGAGRDFIVGGDGNDDLVGDGGDDLIRGNGGSDFINGGTGNDSIRGNDGADTLFGGSGSDFIEGGTGNDFINGGRGNDVLIGNQGADTFIFNDNGGVDTIRDFGENDSIDLSDFNINRFRDLNIFDGRDGAVIAVDNDTRILLIDVEAEDLSAGDFIF